ncbi:uncharacterized membrane protein YkvA (DUF1232 family) [Caldicoprobacter guelmensis]|uniref:YkvA family protein n=1 Tax=Caldicoprobacter guelmensis TaxID=1170224 RepID=UPI00195675EC|nr:DUF1232 domain-containing protein [Caldicoprobacter guelmensis]MBM7582231.1 uncharacterized membrane protein YkvA (DUF1232 family) [Caldicoprobacter guelmensis]
MDLKEKANALKTYIPALFIAMKKKDTPIVAKIFAGITVWYALSPIDVVPDFIPVLGYLDDLIILPLLITLTIKFIPNEIMEICKAEAAGIWKDRKPKKWYYAVPIVILWIVIVAMIVHKCVSIITLLL